MVSRKRGRAEMESPSPALAPAQGLGLLDQIRNLWEFANLMQYVFIFGKAVKIDEDLDIEVHHPLVLPVGVMVLVNFEGLADTKICS